MTGQPSLFGEPGRAQEVQPFLKWPGGKRQLLPVIRRYVPPSFKRYHEGFVGAGALVCDLQPNSAVINDLNGELMNLYGVVKNDPEGLIAHVRQHQRTADYFERLRALDRESGFKSLTPLERASRTIFLNKTCFNGLYRVNSQGQFNVPFGRYANPTICDAAVIRGVSRYLNSADIEIVNEDFAVALSRAGRGDFVYLDPPYDAGFVSYTSAGFDKNDQRRLRDVCDELTERDCKVLLSNSDTPFVRDLYGDAARYSIVEVQAARNINSDATGRGKVTELLIRNYAL